jgi:hypothetical protein
VNERERRRTGPQVGGLAPDRLGGSLDQARRAPGQRARGDERGPGSGHGVPVPDPRRQRQLARAVLERRLGHDPGPVHAATDPVADRRTDTPAHAHSGATDADTGPNAYPDPRDNDPNPGAAVVVRPVIGLDREPGRSGPRQWGRVV